MCTHKDCKTSTPIIMGGILSTLCDREKQKTGSKNRIFCGSRLDLPGIPPLIPTSTRGSSEGPPLKSVPTYLCESVETGKNGTSYPRRVLALWGSVDLDLYIF